MLKAISKQMLPKEYKGVPVLGRGATSLVLDRGDKVEIITMDTIKIELLSDSPYCQNRYQYIELGSHRVSPALSEMPAYSLTMDKLQKYNFSAESRKEARYIFKAYKEILQDIEQEQGGYTAKQHLQKYHNAVMQRIIETEDERLQPLRDMAENITSYWNGDTYILDLAPRNMLWDEDKKQIFINDAVVPLELWAHLNPSSYAYIVRANSKMVNQEREQINKSIAQKRASQDCAML